MKDMAIKKTLTTSYDEARDALTDALKAEGFGVLTHIDVQETLKKKIGADFRRYEIFGACNPTLAHEALSADLEVGVMLPCNVVLYEQDDGKTGLMAMDPASMVVDGAPESFQKVAKDARGKLLRAIEAMK